MNTREPATRGEENREGRTAKRLGNMGKGHKKRFRTEEAVQSDRKEGEMVGRVFTTLDHFWLVHDQQELERKASSRK